jgi:hypothetical protein
MEKLQGKSYYAEYTLASANGKLSDKYTDTLTFALIKDGKIWGQDKWNSVNGGGEARFSGQVTGKKSFLLIEQNGITFDCEIKDKGKKIKALFKDTNTGDIGYIYYKRI